MEPGIKALVLGLHWEKEGQGKWGHMPDFGSALIFLKSSHDNEEQWARKNSKFPEHHRSYPKGPGPPKDFIKGFLLLAITPAPFIFLPVPAQGVRM